VTGKTGFSGCGTVIHSSAVVDATIGEGTRVWQFASVIRGAKIGKGCTVSAYALIDAAVVGDGCLISSGAQLHPGTSIGNEVFVGPGVIFCNDFWPTTNKEGFRADLLLRGFLTVRVNDGASIGAGAVVLPGVTIGKRAMVAANATVRHDVPDDYLLRRDGGMVPIKPEWRQKRMIEA
jgi:UDP-2-acetamido-3-amino-2,3-dideoxy-glucuronate N-acetyltransferase